MLQMETIYTFGKSIIHQSQVDEQVSEILEILKKKEQSFAVNEFILEQTMEELRNQSTF